MIPPKVLKLPFMSVVLRALGRHLEKTPQYVEDALEEERKAAKKESGRPNNFLSLLLQRSDEENRDRTGLSLTDEEISGSLYVFSTAGFETTANTMSYAVALLAALPEWQQWVREELLELDQDVSTWKYEGVYPKCRRSLALMV